MAPLTATSNSDLPFRVAEFDTLVEGLDYAARGETGCNFFSERGLLNVSLSYREIRERAMELAVRLSAQGIERGSRMAIIAETTPDFLVFFFGCQYAGLIPVPLPLSVNLGGHDAYVVRLRAMMTRASVTAAVASPELIGMLREAAEGIGVRLVGTPDDFFALPASGGELRPLQKDEPCYVQYSSGSTSMPRGVLVTQRAITHNARGIGRDGLRLRQGDRSTSWLPLYHDMGLVGFCITPALAQISIDYLATTTFARRPMLWLKLLSENGGTISFSPTFGYDLCLRRSAKIDASQFELAQWRVAGIGGEMVRANVLHNFAERFAEAGFDARAFLPSYGLAESTLAVSFPEPFSGIKVDHVDRDAYARTGLAVPATPNGNGAAEKIRSFVSCGRALPGHQIEIRGPENEQLGEREIGRVCITGPSLMQGYFRDLEATRAMMTEDGWLDTGDMGYMLDGELVITGRSKDLIIHNGRNIWPQDIEWAVERLDGVRAGDVAAFAANGDGDGERVVVIAECRLHDEAARQQLRREVAATVLRSAGVNCEVVLSAPRSLTFTSSGKLSRAAAKADYLRGAILDLADELLPASPEPVLAGMVAGARD
jgi:fatty-acyl-CoA synthase